MASQPFHLFTSLRYDPLLLTSAENSLPILNYISPSPFYMLVYHRDRMLEAAQHFDFHGVAEKLEDGKALHGELLKNVEEYIKQGGKDGPLKAAPSLGPADSLPLNHLPTPEYLLRLDTQPTPSTPFTLLKTTARDHYDASRARALPSNPSGAVYAEVLLYNEVSELTEGTTTSLYLFRGGRWVTPPVGVPAGQFTSETLKGAGDADEGELRRPFAGRWGHSVRSAKVGAGGQRGASRRWALKKGFCMEEPVSVGTVEVGEGVWVSNGVRGFAFGRVIE
ncbi:Aminodeoxychorismate lyase [Kalmusia sp. IMI 367209]|nr:Aminodeoxychorismate lyase [Kalmusia sp. IMI 367209]